MRLEGVEKERIAAAEAEAERLRKEEEEKGRRHPVGQRQQKLRAGCSQVRVSNFFGSKAGHIQNI